MSLSFIVREGFSGFGRAKMPSAITVTISFFALVLLGLFSTVSLSFFDIIQELRSRVELEVFLGDSLTEAQAAGVTGKIRELDGVREAVYVTREEAASIFSRDFGEDVVRILGSNPLPRSIRLKFQPEYAQPDSIAKVVPLITAFAPDLEVRYNQKYLGQIEQNGKLFTLLTGGLGLLIAVATVVLIGYTIRLALYSRQEKIRTMRLVGATAWFIGAPYVIEGALQGILSGLLAAGAVYLVFEQLLYTYEPAMYQILHPSALLIYPSLVLLGLGLGVFGSTLSVGKYLRAASKR
ncbi:MAG: permease-like cell division protein FtsX [Chlorobium sp.]|uniref:cell division protein FtsX n=1 Tax=Chlorobium sp. TaxID=1095 RepID=UPI0025BEE79A|nr:permease-like cell division protein FtsX [Chlorobium sp.]MCF8383846.1 permease-like cell division protein FtsX [Chlorobium sp.]